MTDDQKETGFLTSQIDLDLDQQQSSAKNQPSRMMMHGANSPDPDPNQDDDESDQPKLTPEKKPATLETQANHGGHDQSESSDRVIENTDQENPFEESATFLTQIDYQAKKSPTNKKPHSQTDSKNFQSTNRVEQSCSE